MATDDHRILRLFGIPRRRALESIRANARGEPAGTSVLGVIARDTRKSAAPSDGAGFQRARRDLSLVVFFASGWCNVDYAS